MGENTAIEWAHHTFNPWVGCTKVSPACDHCYAEAWAKRAGTPELWRGERRRTSEANWRQPLKWNRIAAEAGERHRVFCASLADWLDNRVPDEWRDDLANLIEATPNLDWLLLTKRPQNFEKHAPWHADDVPDNVWLGITAENQEEYDRRWPHLMAIEGPIRFVSYEPVLGPLTLHGFAYLPDWVIAGGESGPGARPMHPGWARTVRDELEEEGFAFFFKQWGDWLPAEEAPRPPLWEFQDGTTMERQMFPDFDDPENAARWDAGLQFRAEGYTQVISWRVGKKRAGRLLDGASHDGFPASLLDSATHDGFPEPTEREE